MYNARGFINLAILISMIVLISVFGLDMKEPYPKGMIKAYSEPYVRFLAYLSVYLISFYNTSISFVLLIGVLLLHIDYVNLAV